MTIESSTSVTSINTQNSTDKNSNKINIERIKRSLLFNMTVENQYIKDFFGGKIKNPELYALLQTIASLSEDVNNEVSQPARALLADLFREAGLNKHLKTSLASYGNARFNESINGKTGQQVNKKTLEKLTAFEWACFSLGANKRTVDKYARSYKENSIDKNFAETFHLRDELVFSQHFANSAKRLGFINLEQEKSRLDLSIFDLIDEKTISLRREKLEESIPGRLLDESSWVVHALKGNFTVKNPMVDWIIEGKLSEEHLDIALGWINHTQIPIKNKDGSVSFHEDCDEGAKILLKILGGIQGHKKRKFQIQQSCQRSLCRIYGKFDPAEMSRKDQMFAIDDVSKASLFEWALGGRIPTQSQNQIIEDSDILPTKDWPLYRLRVSLLLENAGYAPTSVNAVRNMATYSLAQSLQPEWREIERKFMANRPTAPEEGQKRIDLAEHLKVGMTTAEVYESLLQLWSANHKDSCRRLLGVLADLAEGTEEGLKLFRSMKGLTRRDARDMSDTARSVLLSLAVIAQGTKNLKDILNDFGSHELNRVTRKTLLDNMDDYMKNKQDQELLSRLSAFSLFYALDDRADTVKASLARRAIEMLGASRKAKRNVETGRILRANNVMKLARYLGGRSLARNANKAIKTLPIDPGPPEPGFFRRMWARLRGRSS